MRERLTTLGEIVGAGLVTTGVLLIDVAAGVIVGGLTLIGVSFLADRAAT